MISIQKNFLFIHIPKTAGNSIQTVLSDYSEDQLLAIAAHQDGVERFNVINRKYGTIKHSTLSYYKSVMEKNVYRKLYKFTILRNPWDRVISHYFSPHRGVTEWDRSGFIKLIGHLPTARHYICHASLLARGFEKFGIQWSTIQKKIDSDVDFIIRFERLSEDFKVVCDRLDIPFQDLPRRNVSGKAHYSTYYDHELREIVRSKFKEEISYGNYEFENA